MALVPREVLFVYEEVVISVELPKPAIQHIKMLIRKVLPHDVDIILIADLEESFQKITVSEVPPSYLAIIIRVKGKEYTHYYRISIAVLKLRCCLQELKTWMRVEKVLEQHPIDGCNLDSTVVVRVIT